jgi:ATP phosphoribosyltransferase
VLLENAGLAVYKPNPRQFQAVIPSLPEVVVLFQRAGDIAVSVHDGTVDFGITGWDVVMEKGGSNGQVLPLYKELGFGSCTLHVIVPETWEAVNTMTDLAAHANSLGRPLRVATRFPNCAMAFFKKHQLDKVQLVEAEGTLEIAPTIGYSDLIVDLVSTGTTLRDNRLRPLADGMILESQACLVANRLALKTQPLVLETAKRLIEFIVAHLRAKENVAIFANIRGETEQAIAARMLPKPIIGGLQGPTISPLITRDGGDWFAVNIIVSKHYLPQAIDELREVGGSGVVVMPVTYIFEEEPAAYREMIEKING